MMKKRTVFETITAPERMNQIAEGVLLILEESKLTIPEGIMICEGLKIELIRRWVEE